MSVLVAKVGRSGAGGANSAYITRLSAAEKIAFYHLEQLEAEVIAEARTNAIAYAHAREEIELGKGQAVREKSAPPSQVERKPAGHLKNSEDAEGAADSAARKFPGEINPTTKTGEVSPANEASLETIKNASQKPKGKRQARTHYRLIASWEGKETSENAVAEVKFFLEKQFPKARAIIAVHQDTDDTHAHVWIDARQTDGKKIHLNDRQFATLDEKWTEQYDRRYGTNYAPEYKALKEETKVWKREMYEWRKSRTKNQTGSAGKVENAEVSEVTKIKEIKEKTERARLLAPPPKPQRAADRFKTDYWKEKEVRQMTGAAYEKINAGPSYSDAQRGSRLTQTAERVAKTDDQFTRGAELSNPGTEPDDRSKQSKNDSDKRFGERTKSHFARAAQDDAEFVRSDNEDHQLSEDSRTGFAEDEIQRSFDIDQCDVYFQRTRRFSEEFTDQQISQQQFYEDRSGRGTADGNGIVRSNQADFPGNSTIGKFHAEVSQLPAVQFEQPQFQMDAQAMIKDTLQMIQTSLERQRIEMNEGAIDLLHEHLGYTLKLDPSPNLLAKIDRFNSRSESPDEHIETENKSWLAAHHEYLSKLSAEDLDREARLIAEEFEEDLVEQKEVAAYQEEKMVFTL